MIRKSKDLKKLNKFENQFQSVHEVFVTSSTRVMTNEKRLAFLFT